MYDDFSVSKRYKQVISELQSFEKLCISINRGETIVLGWMPFDMFLACQAILKVLIVTDFAWDNGPDAKRLLLGIESNINTFKTHDNLNIGEKVMYDGVAAALQVILDGYQKERQS